MSAPVETVIHEAVGSRFATWVTGLGAPVAARIERLPVPVRRVVRAVVNVPRFLLLLLFGLWRRLVSPLYGQTCKYYPSCSAYGTQSVQRHGAARGVVLTVWRILRCNPWSSGGIDDVPPAPPREAPPAPHNEDLMRHVGASTPIRRGAPWD